MGDKRDLRVHEIAKIFGVETKEIMSIFKEKGVKIKTALSSVSYEKYSFLFDEYKLAISKEELDKMLEAPVKSKSKTNTSKSSKTTSTSNKNEQKKKSTDKFSKFVLVKKSKDEENEENEEQDNVNEQKKIKMVKKTSIIDDKVNLNNLVLVKKEEKQVDKEEEKEIDNENKKEVKSEKQIETKNEIVVDNKKEEKEKDDSSSIDFSKRNAVLKKSGNKKFFTSVTFEETTIKKVVKKEQSKNNDSEKDKDNKVDKNLNIDDPNNLSDDKKNIKFKNYNNLKKIDEIIISDDRKEELIKKSDDKKVEPVSKDDKKKTVTTDKTKEKEKSKDFNAKPEITPEKKKSIKEEKKLRKRMLEEEKQRKKEEELAQKEYIAQKAKKEREIKDKTIFVDDVLSVINLAEKMDIGQNEIALQAMKLGILNLNQKIDFETAELLGDEFGFIIKRNETIDDDFKDIPIVEDKDNELSIRPPVVTIMGHVDHGKTSLLDYIRKERVAQGEAGGITQHIGAYQVNVNKRPITFIDTPGHKAFTEMRAQGANATDIVVLVVAADDGVKPQTIEAIDHTFAAGVPVIVAINKIDKQGVDPEKVKKELTQHGITVEDWGGETVSVELSALTGENVDKLLEYILLVADMQEFKANPNNETPHGVVIESNLDKGMGPIATVLVKNGKFKIGDPITIGGHYGKIRTLKNFRNDNLKEALPSTPVRISGISGVPEIGSIVRIMKNDKIAREYAEYNLKVQKNKEVVSTLDEWSKKEGTKQLNVIIKADTFGTVQAIKTSLIKLSNEQVTVNIIHSNVGGISDSDVTLAKAAGAIICGFNVRALNRVDQYAEENKIEIRTYRIIYELIEDIQNIMKGLLEKKSVEEIIGSVEIRKVYRIPKVGAVAGCFVTNGMVKKDAKVRVIRDGIVIFDGKLKSLKRYQDEADEVKAGFECGLTIDRYNDIKENDTLEIYIAKELEQQLIINE